MSANLWKSYTFSVQVAAAGTTGVQMLSYDSQLSRVRIDLTVARDGTEPAGSTWLVQRSTDLVRWSTVRGGTSIPVSAVALPLDDYEFVANADNHYRVQVYSAGSLVQTYTDAITPVLTEVWLKDIVRPFLNRPVKVSDAGEMTRKARLGLFDVVGRSSPLAVTDVRAGKAYQLVLEADSLDEVNSLDTLLDSGDVVFLQTPPGYPVPTGYYAIGDTTSTWRTLPPAQSPVRWFTLPLTTVDAPSPEVVGATTNWAAVAATYATWADLVAAATTWNDVVDTIAGVDDVIVV